MTEASPKPIRVMIVDDTTTMREVLRRVLSSDPEVEVVYSAIHGGDAMEHLDTARPDVVVLDLEMPVMDGMSTLIAIRRQHPRLPVILFSTHSLRGARITIEALTRGATDYAHKPVAASLAEGIRTVRTELLAKVKLHGRPSPVDASPGQLQVTACAPCSSAPPELLVVGASTGGPNALVTLFANLRKPLPIPALVVQHMPPVFTRMLARRLSEQTGHIVREARDGDPIEPGIVLLAPGDHHLRVVRRDGAWVAGVDQGLHELSCRPSIDVLFRSAADGWGSRTVGVVLTGMGVDGVDGCARLVGAGARVLVQDQESSVVWGMPGAVYQRGLSHHCASPVRLADKLNACLGPAAVRARAQGGRLDVKIA